MKTFCEEYLENPNLKDVKLLNAEITVIEKLIKEKVKSNEVTIDENLLIFQPILKRLAEAKARNNDRIR